MIQNASGENTLRHFQSKALISRQHGIIRTEGSNQGALQKKKTENDLQKTEEEFGL